jgi:hypothetical protein
MRLSGRPRFRRLLALVCSVTIAGSLSLTEPATAQQPLALGVVGAMAMAAPTDSSTANSGDFATDRFGDAWDFNNADDLTPTTRGLSVGMSGLGLSHLTTSNSVLTGTATSNSYLVLGATGPRVMPWGRDTRNFPVDADQYTQLTISMYSTRSMGMGVFYQLCVDGPSTCYNGSPFGVSPGWHVYTIDLKKATTYYPTHQRWGGSASMVRLGFNPPAATNFQIDWIRLGSAGTTGLNPAQPQPTILKPSAVSGSDYATAVRGRPWNVHAPGDVSLGGIGDVSYSATGLRGKNVVTATIPRGNDPHLQLPVPTPIDGSKYNHFSVDICYDGQFSLTDKPGGGMNGRVIWQIAGENFARNSQDFLVFPGCQLIDLDLSAAPNLVEDETDVSKPGGLRGFSGHSIVALRFDPDEDPGARYFTVRSIKLTATDAATGGSPIQFADRNWQAGTTADIWLDPTGAGTALRQIARSISTTAGGNTFNWLGRDVGNAVVPAGSYFVKVRLNNAAAGTAVYSTGRLVVTPAPTPTPTPTPIPKPAPNPTPAPTPTPAVIVDGQFVTDTSTHAVYRVVGGAPIYVSSWSAFGGGKSTTAVSHERLSAMPRFPVSGTFLRATGSGEVYRIVGGAPVYVSSWAAMGGSRSTFEVDAAAIAHSGGVGYWSHLAAVPAAGTFVRASGSGEVYRIAGGAPLYVASWAGVGGEQSAVLVDAAAVAHAGTAGHWSHLNWYPLTTTFVQPGGSTAVYQVVNGVATHLLSWTSVGGPKPYTIVHPLAITNAGKGGHYNHLK